MTAVTKRGPRILAVDAGGTLTDSFVVDRDGRFVVGKAQTTPDNEANGLITSLGDALSHWDLQVEDVIPNIVSGIYSGTAMLNRLVERKGQNIGVLVTAGFEDYLRLERGAQTYLGYSYSDRLHLVTHKHNEPIVPRDQICGVRGRINVLGEERIPLYEHEVEKAVKHLVKKDVKAICINFLHSYINDTHEQKAKKIALDTLKRLGVDIPLFLASELYSVSQDFARLNTVLVEAYAAEPSRKQLFNIEHKLNDLGAKFDLRVMASHGGTISTEANELARTLISGPIGGVVGSHHLAKKLGFDNVVCSDIGGTSFDVSLITGGQYNIQTQPNMARFLLKIPLIEIDTVGAGTGSFIRLNPTSKRIEIGPDSAGHLIGVSNPDSGLTTPTISDCDVILGYLNPDNFLGGDIQLDRDHAIQVVKKQIADPLGLDVYEAAEGIVQLFEDDLKNELLSRVLGKGYTPESYRLISYGGGGPVHVAGYSDGLHFEDILVPSWAAGFSAYGCACTDLEYRTDRTVNVATTAEIDNMDQFAEAINVSWEEMEEHIAKEYAKNNISQADINYRYFVRMQYVGQLNDIEIEVPFNRISTQQQVEEIIQLFEEAYSKMYSLSARSPELGYLVTTTVVTGVVPCEKPELPNEPLHDEVAELSGTRNVYYKGEWIEASIYIIEDLKAGNKIEGFSIVESPSTTFVVPTGFEAYLDEHLIFHLRKVKE